MNIEISATRNFLLNGKQGQRRSEVIEREALALLFLSPEKYLTIFLENKIIMDKKQDVLAKQFSRYLTGFCLSKAILEDYSRVIAKLEGVDQQQVKDRIDQRTKELFEEIKKEYPLE